MFSLKYLIVQKTYCRIVQKTYCSFQHWMMTRAPCLPPPWGPPPFQTPGPAGNDVFCLFDALFKFDVAFALDPIVVSHLQHHRWSRCILLHLIPFLRTIVSYITYASPVLKRHVSHVLHMWAVQVQNCPLFRQPRSDHQSVLFMTRREVRTKFQ
jgi:hypothetical protein